MIVKGPGGSALGQKERKRKYHTKSPKFIGTRDLVYFTINTHSLNPRITISTLKAKFTCQPNPILYSLFLLSTINKRVVLSTIYYPLFFFPFLFLFLHIYFSQLCVYLFSFFFSQLFFLLFFFFRGTYIIRTQHNSHHYKLNSPTLSLEFPSQNHSIDNSPLPHT